MRVISPLARGLQRAADSILITEHFSPLSPTKSFYKSVVTLSYLYPAASAHARKESGDRRRGAEGVGACARIREAPAPLALSAPRVAENGTKNGAQAVEIP